MTGSVEDRLRKVEIELQQLKHERGNSPSHWLSSITGSFRDDPEFIEILRLGEEFRQSDRPVE